MSLQAPKSCGEAVFQYCNYGYDKTKYSSYQDCISRHPAVACPDGDTIYENKEKPKTQNQINYDEAVRQFGESTAKQMLKDNNYVMPYIAPVITGGFVKNNRPLIAVFLIVGIYLGYKRFIKK